MYTVGLVCAFLMFVGVITFFISINLKRRKNPVEKRKLHRQKEASYAREVYIPKTPVKAKKSTSQTSSYRRTHGVLDEDYGTTDDLLLRAGVAAYILSEPSNADDSPYTKNSSYDSGYSSSSSSSSSSDSSDSCSSSD